MPIDTNHLERALRPVPMGRRNWLFCWTELGVKQVGIIQSLLVTCKLHGIHPHTYLVDVLQRISQHPAGRVPDLTPRVWKTRFVDNPLRSDLDIRDRIIERLKFLDSVKAQQTMMAFNLDTRVSFESSKHGRQFGTSIKFNRKTVMVLTEDRNQWRVPPYILTPIKDATPKQRFVYANKATQEKTVDTNVAPVLLRPRMNGYPTRI